MVNKTRLLVLVGERIMIKHYSILTEETYAGLIKRFIFIHHKRHLKSMGKIDMEIV